jgi:four helix bundle suffix protein
LEELRLDYEDFLRQRGLPLWPPSHPALLRFKSKRCSSMAELLDWEKEELEEEKKGRTRTDTDEQRQEGAPILSVPFRECPRVSASSQLKAQLQANALLSLLNLCCWLLDRQIAAQAEAFAREGGFTERLYRVRTGRRGK